MARTKTWVQTDWVRGVIFNTRGILKDVFGFKIHSTFKGEWSEVMLDRQEEIGPLRQDGRIEGREVK